MLIFEPFEPATTIDLKLLKSEKWTLSRPACFVTSVVQNSIDLENKQIQTCKLHTITWGKLGMGLQMPTMGKKRGVQKQKKAKIMEKGGKNDKKIDFLG